MERRYSIFEAKAKLSEIIRLVRADSIVVITDRGVPVVTLQPYQPENQEAESRLEDLAKRGRVRRATKKFSKLEALAKLPGALKTFLDER